MGFMTGVITGIAVAAGAAAVYLSRSGSRVRDQYRVEDRLAVLGDEMERRARDLQASVHSQLAEVRSRNDLTAGRLDGAAASAAEAAAAADVQSHAGDVADAAGREPGTGPTRVKRGTKSAG